MYVVRLMLVCILLLTCVDMCASAEGEEFSEDLLIGTSALYKDGSRNIYYDFLYRIHLLVVEGDFTQYSLGTGFFIGYQWYNAATTSSSNIKMQLYHVLSLDPGEPYIGNYTLAHETGWIAAVQGYNKYFLDSALSVDHSSSSSHYIIAVVSDRNAIHPILHDYCSGDSKVVLEATVSTVPSVGDNIYFTYDPASSQGCTSYSIQGIFLQTQLASYCSMQAVLEGNSAQIYSPASSVTSECWVIRADKESHELKVTKESFNLVDSIGCSQESLNIEAFMLHPDYSPTALGTFCGTALFDSQSSQLPYIKFQLYRSQAGSSGLFHFRIESIELTGEEDGIATWMIIVFALGGCGIIFGSWFCIKRHQKRVEDRKKHNEKEAAAKKASEEMAKKRAQNKVVEQQKNNKPQPDGLTSRSSSVTHQASMTAVTITGLHPLSDRDEDTEHKKEKKKKKHRKEKKSSKISPETAVINVNPPPPPSAPTPPSAPHQISSQGYLGHTYNSAHDYNIHIPEHQLHQDGYIHSYARPPPPFAEQNPDSAYPPPPSYEASFAWNVPAAPVYIDPQT